MKKCDIIVPVYNALDCLKPCFDSILANTNMDENNLIIINDKSSDSKVLPFLNDYKKKHKNITIINNEENLGFVGTVNRGMTSSKNDVLLLNSDTEVTEGWMDKIKKCAYSKSNIATVTPLSNNATLASVPIIFEKNDIPKGYTLESFAKLIDECSYRDYPELPTGHGFCLYIKRNVLDELGYFDMESFGKGYGEENDFCFRCLDAGYSNVLCDDAFVYHKESQSFSESKNALIEQGLEVLKKRYPEYFDRLSLWCSKKDLKYIGENILARIGANNNKKNVLFVIHDWKNIRHNLGGTSLHAWDIIRNLKNDFNFHVLAPEEGNYKVYSYWACNDVETVVSFPGVSQMSMLPFYNNDYYLMIKDIFKIYSIDIVHIHHLINNYFDIMRVIKENNVYSIMTLHDYYTVCPSINKLYKNDKYCGNCDNTKCSECIINVCTTPKRGLSTIKAWHLQWHEFLKNCDLLITPSQAAKNEILMKYNDLDITVIEHGVDYKKTYSDLSLDDEYMDVAFIGAIGIHKGSNILYDLIKTNKMKKIRIHLFGIIDKPNVKNNSHFINHGKYKREELPQLLKENNIKLVCLFSTWPETFSYTLTESVASGVPVLAFDFGAIAERIKKFNLGWVIPFNSNTEDVIYTMNLIRNDKKSYKKVIEFINNYKYRSTKNMAKEYFNIYDKVVKNNRSYDLELLKKQIKNGIKNGVVINYSNYEWVFSTLKWRIISKFKIPQPIKNVIKKVKNRG